MYTDFYGFSGLPFQLTPDARFFFGSSVHNRALAHLTYGLEQGEGFIIITGDIGAGKTTLVEHLLGQLDSSKYVAAKIANTQLGADDMLRMVASAFGIALDGDKASLLRRVESFLLRVQDGGQRALLMIDECQNLSIPALEELRMLSNLQASGRSPLQCFLLGQPQFRETLARSELDQLRQRVLASYHLGPLDTEETRSYVEHRLRTVGWTDDPKLADDVFPAVHRRTEGIPRRINTLCSRLLLFGFLEERHELTAPHVEEVASDLDRELMQVLPGETGAPQRSAAPSKPAFGADAELLRRIELLEAYVRSHDKAIRRALQIAAEYIEGKKP
jgi:putative secretion ATPase (PEP-CTERM system associated)